MKKRNEILGFYKWTLPLQENLFNELSSSVDFEELGKGRRGNHLVNMEDEFVPLVRTTSKFNKPAHQFSDTHCLIADNIVNRAKNEIDLEDKSISFNNALIEMYDK